MQFISFAAFALVLLGMYVSIRRQYASPGLIAGLGMVGSIFTMTLFLLSRDANVLQSIVMGILIGILFAGATLAIAWYFQSNELRAQYTRQNSSPDTQAEEYYEETEHTA